MKKLSEKQLRKLISEEVSQMEGIEEMTSEEVQELEEGLFDRMKANVAGNVAGLAAGAKNLGSGIAGVARGAVAGAKAAATGASQTTTAGKTQIDAAQVKALTAAVSRLSGFQKTIVKALDDLQNDIGKMNFGNLQQKVQSKYGSLNGKLRKDFGELVNFRKDLEAAKTGNTQALTITANPSTPPTSKEE